MKVVLFSVFILIMVVQTASKLARPSSKISTIENIKKTRKFSRELNSGDPFSGRDNRNFPEFSLPKIGREFRRMKKFHLRYDPISTREPSLHRKPEPILKFRSPEQLQEYLFSEAGNAKHFLNQDDSLSNQGSIEYARNSRGSDSSFTGEFDHDSTSRPENVEILKPLNLIKSSRKKYRRFDGENRKENYGYRLRNRRRRPTRLHSYGLPYWCPPPWYKTKNLLYLPKLNTSRHEEVTTRSTPEPTSSPVLTPRDYISQLKQIVDELDALSEESKEECSIEKSNGKPDSDKRKKENETISETKEKIDKLLIPILNKISHDLNETFSTVSPAAKKAEEAEGSSKKAKEKESSSSENEKEIESKKEPHLKHNFPCKIDGYWMCLADELQINISTMPNLTMKVNVIAENPKTSIITKDWAVSGITLSTTGGPFLMAAISPEKRKVANFVGQCRSCNEDDVLFGVWTLSGAAKDCSEIFSNFQNKMVIFKRGRSQQVKEEKSSSKT